jgi:pheromone shutdown protein TraB
MTEPETSTERPGDPVLVRQPPPGERGERDDGSVRVVGTAHVSQESVDEVRQVVSERRPDVVAVELDEDRHRQIRGETPDDLEATDLLKGNTVFQFLAYWMLSYVQTRLGERFDIEPGAEMRAAIDAAQSVGVGVALVDRDIQVTIQRFWARMTLPEKIKTVSGLAFGAADPPAIAVTTAAVVGLFAGPLVGLVSAFGLGLSAAEMSPVVAGGLAALAVGYLLFEVGGIRNENAGIMLGVAGCLLVGAAMAVTGLGADVVGGVVGGVAAYLLGGVFLAAAAGLVLGSLLGVWLSTDADTEEFEGPLDVDDLTDADVVTALLEEFRRFSPGGAEALIDERDAYIAHHLVGLRERGYDVVAVVGAGHQQGIERYLDRPETVPPFESLVGRETGSRFSLYQLFGYLLSFGFVTFFGLLALGGAGDAFLLRLFVAWFLFNGVFAFGLAKLAGARWMSAAVGGAVAWLTSVNPLLAPGWFAGYFELRYVSVNVADISRLNDILGDEESPLRDVVSRMFDVPLFRLIMIVAMTNVGSMIGTFLFPFVVVPLVVPGGDVSLITDALVRGADRAVDILVGVVG